MRRTKKFNAGIIASKKAGLGTIFSSNEELYEVLENDEQWWDAKSGKWSRSVKPSTSIFADDIGDATGIVRIRVMAHPSDVDNAVRRIKKLDGLKVTDISEPYKNRKGEGFRVYITGLLV